VGQNFWNPQEVQIVHPVNGRPKVWDTYPDRAGAESVAATLRHHGMFSQVRRIDGDPGVCS